MKVLLALLILMLIALQYRLWFGEGSVQEVWRLNQESKQARAELIRLRGRNQALEAEVADLKSGLDAIEERARSELGMIDSEEEFYQFVREKRVDQTVRTLELPEAEQVDGRKLIDRSGAASGAASGAVSGAVSGAASSAVPANTEQ